MNLEYKQFLNSLPVYPESGCSYYPEKLSQIKGFGLSEIPDKEILDMLLRFGFRRSGNFYYRTACASCSHCLSYRIPLEKFVVSSNRKRIQKKNLDLRIESGPPEMNSEKQNLYIRYQRSRHEGSYGISEEELLETMNFQMYEGSENSSEIRIWKEKQLLGWILLDRGKETVSAVYSVFDPEKKERSLGNLLILSSILWAKENGYKEYHLGLFLPGHPKMDYKSQWKPAEILDKDSGDWEDSEIYLHKYLSGFG